MPFVRSGPFEAAIVAVRGAFGWEERGGGDAVVSGRDVRDAGNVRDELAFRSKDFPGLAD